MSELVFLKLGGSLITEKDKVSTVRSDTLKRIAEEVAAACSERPELRLVLGHGSGSFGHVPAKKYKTRGGVKTAEEWAGFVEVWRQAEALDRIVVDALLKAGLKILIFPPVAVASAQDGKIKEWNLVPLRGALDAGIVPVVYGDVALDSVRGGTILSTEDLFVYLAMQLHPDRILLAGDEEGVFADYPQRSKLIPTITPTSFPKFAAALGGAAGADVTGGMAEKVRAMLELIKKEPNCKISIFSGLKPGAIKEALSGKTMGTLLWSD